MVNWIKVIEDNFSKDYLLLSLFSDNDLKLVSAILNTYGFVSLENVKELIIDYISYLKIDLFGDEYV